MKECSKYVSVSDDKHSSNAYHHYLLASNNEKGMIRVERNGEAQNIEVLYCDNADYGATAGIEMLSPELLADGKIGYLAMGDMTEISEFDDTMKVFEKTKGIIMDLRYGNPYINFVVSDYFKGKEKTAF